jgi:hypothetical protein
MDILVTQGRRARRPYIFDINAMKKTYPIRENPRPHPRPPSASPIRVNPRKIRAHPRPQSMVKWVFW